LAGGFEYHDRVLLYHLSERKIVRKREKELEIEIERRRKRENRYVIKKV
jgi:hypothetical protein